MKIIRIKENIEELVIENYLVDTIFINNCSKLKSITCTIPLDNLKELSITNCENLSVISFKKRLQDLTMINIINNSNDNLVIKLPELPNIKSIKIVDNKIISFNLKKKASSLLYFTYNYNKTLNFSLPIELPNLVHLNISNNLINVLELNYDYNSLINLIANDNNIKDAELYGRFDNIEMINLNNNNLKTFKLTDEDDTLSFRQLKYLLLNSNDLYYLIIPHLLLNLERLELHNNDKFGYININVNYSKVSLLSLSKCITITPSIQYFLKISKTQNDSFKLIDENNKPIKKVKLSVKKNKVKLKKI